MKNQNKVKNVLLRKLADNSETGDLSNLHHSSPPDPKPHPTEHQ